MTIYVSSGPGQADVPDVVGSTEKNTRKKIEKAGFEVDVEEAFSETVKAGRVIDTRPSAQTQIDLGKTVTLIVSRGGPEEAEIPDVVGLSQAEATGAAPSGRGLRGQRPARRRSATGDGGHRHGDEPGLRARSCARGRRWRSRSPRRPRRSTCPTCGGDTLNEALGQLGDAGLRGRAGRERTVDSPTRTASCSRRTRPAGKAKKGATVTIIVGRYTSRPDTTTRRTRPRPAPETTP